jgi:hypothetical protein
VPSARTYGFVITGSYLEYLMRRTAAQKAVTRGAQNLAQAQNHGSTAPASVLVSTSALLQRATAEIKQLRRKLGAQKRCARARVKSRDTSLKNTKAQLSELTTMHTLTLQSLATLQDDHNGICARLTLSNLAHSQATQLLGCVMNELQRTQHLLKMCQSDLGQAQDHGKYLRGRIQTLNCEVRTLRARAKLLKARESRSCPITPQVFKLKEKGAVPLPLRVTILKLVSLGIGTKHLMPAIQCVSNLFHVQLKGWLSPASVRNIIHEGGVAAHLQVAQAMHESSDGTISSDSTSHKSINYVAKHYIATSPNPDTQPRRFALPITTIDEHSSQAQLEDWIHTLRFHADMFRRRFNAPITAEFWREFVSKLRGMMTDHANDQKLMIKLFTEWKRELERETRGSKYLSSLLALELLELMARALADNGEEPVAWSTLSHKEQVQRTGATFRKLCLAFG